MAPRLPVTAAAIAVLTPCFSNALWAGQAGATPAEGMQKNAARQVTGLW